MPRHDRSTDFLVAILLTAIGAYQLETVLRQPDLGLPSHDIYAAQIPNAIYARNALAQGFGLLWNNLQNCGQPFLPATNVSLSYPPYWLFLAVGNPDDALGLIAVFHLALGGFATHLLCRTLGMQRAAALCGALTFELGGTATGMAAWVPTMMLGAYAWLAAAAYCAERLLKSYRVADALALAVALGMQGLLGHPQYVLFTYILLGLRLLWEIPLRRAQAPRLAGLFVPAMLFAPLLAAAQWLPLFEMARDSVRNRPLEMSEALLRPRFTWDQIRVWLDPNESNLKSFTIVTVALVPFALRRGRERARVLFFASAALLWMVLASDNPLSDAFLDLPLVNLFRDPTRAVWMAEFCLCPVVAAGAHALLNCATLPAASRRIAAVALPALLAAHLHLTNDAPILRYAHSAELYQPAAAAAASARALLTAQDRVYLAGPGIAWSAKAASIHRLPSIDDYEPVTQARYAGLVVRMLFGRPLRAITDYYHRMSKIPRSLPLFNLLATRWVIAKQVDGTRRWPDGPPFVERWRSGDVALFENPEALPRAHFVPRLEVEPDAERLLERLASPEHDPRNVTLVEEMPRDGYLGAGGSVAFDLSIEADRAEEVVLYLHADRGGFLALTDQHTPGWQAWVNGTETPILRANFAFRAVRVPQGESLVRFVYQPRSVTLGLWISGLALYAVLARVVWQLLPSVRRAARRH